MCISPIRIRNPNYKSKLPYSFLKDTSSLYLNVPCGVCPQCVAFRQMSIVQRVQMEGLENYIFFSTLTYNDESIPKITTSSGYTLKYADVSDVQKMVKRLRKSNAFGRPFRYFAVSELGGSRGRPHFHILWLIPKYEGDDYCDILNLEKLLFDKVLLEWRRNYGSNRKPVYRPLCTYIRKFVRGKLRCTYDLHYVRPNLDSDESTVAFYVTKYMIKPSDRVVKLQRALHLNLDEDEYNDIWSLIRPRWFSSLRFGRNQSADDYIRSCISRSKSVSDFPKFYSPSDGSSFPLAHYYKTFGDLYSMADHLDFFYNSDMSADNVVYQDVEALRSVDRVINQFNKRVDVVDEHDESEIFNELFNL